ncbi:serine/arginine repetitive matrix protein 1 [Panicum miliaceum]|uniref:Serine/arginine repetitive matrix protein 1 n=1 Tax=Panicum miliaceum TaxID=4540 RepID=A0A3L6Q5Z3_PANMI|nr:serine/arginine repetitive matrix protein 1 [Panicum miliaceum]
MVAMGVDEDEERRMDERPMHQGCMAGFLHLFDRPQTLSGRRIHGSPRRLLSSGSSGSATPSERSMPLDRATPAPSSPDMTPPAAPRPSLQVPPLDPKDGAGGGGAGGWAAPSWRLPRLSLDSRAVVDGRGKLRPREIRTASSPGAPPSPSAGAGAGDERRSPSVVARLMGLDALPHGQAGDCAHSGAASPAALRRSASERVPRDPSHFRFVDPAFFERPASPLPPLVERRPSSPAAPAPAAEAAMRRAPDPGCPRAFQRRSRFDAHEVFPEPAKRADPAAAGAHGEIALYGEIERRLRKRGIAEPARDLETLKQILEALQLKGLLHHTPTPPPPVRTAPQPPPIVVMRPNHRAQLQVQPPARLTPARRLRVDVDRARRPRSPDPSASPVRSPASPARRGPHSPQRRVSPVQSPKQQQQPSPPFRRPSGFDSAGARARIARRAAHNAAALSPDDEASTTFSDGGSSSSFSASSRWDLEPQPDSRTDRGLLERCGKLLSSIQAFTGGDAAGSDQQPSPVSVLDAVAFLADEDSPSSSSGSKRAIDFSSSSVGRAGPKPAATTASDPEDDEWALGTWSAGPEASGDPDYAYVAELVRLFGGARGRRLRDPADVYKAAEQRRLQRGCDDPGDTWHHRRLLCGAVGEALERQRAACPWEPAAWLRGAELVGHVWAEVRRAAEPAPPPAAAAEEDVEAEEDLNAVTCSAIRRDMAADEARWAPTQQQRRVGVVCGAEAAEAVLQIERMVFRDLVADTIRELADADRPLPRRKLVF